MDLLQNAKDILEDKYFGIFINSADYQNHELITTSMCFCKTISQSFNSPLARNKLLINCPGARRCLNITSENDELANKISMHNNLKKNFVTSALKEIPVISQPIYNIVFTKNEKPLIFPYFIMSICENVFVNSVETGKITISFKCTESQKHGGIDDDEIVMGIPYDVANLLFN